MRQRAAGRPLHAHRPDAGASAGGRVEAEHRAELNSIALTETSVDVLTMEVAWLCDRKRVPGVIQRRGRPPAEDVTGLSALVEQARALCDKGHLQEACDGLIEVATTFEEFRD